MCTPAAQPTAWVSRLTTRCPQTDPEKAFLQPCLKHKTWGVGGALGERPGIGEPSCQLLWGQHPCCPAGRSHQCHQPVTNLSLGAGRRMALVGTGDQEMEPTPGILPRLPGRPLDFGQRGPCCGQLWAGPDGAAARGEGFSGRPRGHPHSVSVSSPFPSGLLPSSRQPRAPQPPTLPPRLHAGPLRAWLSAQPPRHLDTANAQGRIRPAAPRPGWAQRGRGLHATPCGHRGSWASGRG